MATVIARQPRCCCPKNTDCPNLDTGTGKMTTTTGATMSKTVRVIVSGGVVQHVEVPAGVTVIIRDYDVDGVESDLLQQDRGGDNYVETIWTPER